MTDLAVGMEYHPGQRDKRGNPLEAPGKDFPVWFYLFKEEGYHCRRRGFLSQKLLYEEVGPASKTVIFVTV